MGTTHKLGMTHLKVGGTNSVPSSGSLTLEHWQVRYNKVSCLENLPVIALPAASWQHLALCLAASVVTLLYGPSVGHWAIYRYFKIGGPPEEACATGGQRCCFFVNQWLSFISLQRSLGNELGNRFTKKRICLKLNSGISKYCLNPFITTCHLVFFLNLGVLCVFLPGLCRLFLFL